MSTKHVTITIAFNTPNVPTFQGAQERIHKFGHMWFNTDYDPITGLSRPVQVTLNIVSGGYSFDLTQPSPIAFAVNPAPKGLSTNRQLPTVLSQSASTLVFLNQNQDPGWYFYTVYFNGPTGPFSWDPILINRC